MRFNDLYEAPMAPHDIEANTHAVFDKLGKHASTVYSKLKGLHDKVSSEIESEQDKKQKQAEKETARQAAIQAKADKQAKKLKKLKNRKDGQKTLADPNDDIPSTIAHIVTDRTPEQSADIEEMHGYDAQQIQEAQLEVDKQLKRLAKLPEALRKAFLSSDFLNDGDRTTDDLNIVLAKQPEKGFEAAETLMMRDIYGENEVWIDALTNDKPEQAAAKLVELCKAMGRDFDKRNLAATGSGKGASYPVGLGVIKIISTQRQILQQRLLQLKGSIDQLANEPLPTAQPQAQAKPTAPVPGEKPVTQESLRRLRPVVEQLRRKM